MEKNMFQTTNQLKNDISEAILNIAVLGEGEIGATIALTLKYRDWTGLWNGFPEFSTSCTRSHIRKFE